MKLIEIFQKPNVVDMGGLTMVSVRPTHRRRGILRRMIEAHFADVAARGEPLSGLWASEAPIYGRFGYGNAVTRHNLSINAPGAGFADYLGTDVVRLVSRSDAERLLPEIYERRRLDRSGMLSRSDAWWRVRHFHDGADVRRGWTERRFAIAYRDGAPVGFVVYRQKGEWDDWQPLGVVKVEQLIGDVEAQLALWGFVTSIDLFPTVEWWNAPTDDPIRWRAANARAVAEKLGDSLWVRLIDVDRALMARRYRSSGDLVLAITDSHLPSNAGSRRFTVTEGGEAVCEQTDDEPHVRLDIATLGALYLGGRNANQMAAAGLIDGDPDDVRRLDEMLAWDAPWCPEVF